MGWRETGRTCPKSVLAHESGQAAVETALLMPLMVFFSLGILQLALMQHARLLTEYAAFSAARAGIVWNANNERMRDAAILALLPTRERLRGQKDVPWELKPLGQAYTRFLEADTEFTRLDWGETRADINGVPLRGLVRVDTLSPAAASDAENAGGGDAWEELDFDGAGALRSLFDASRPDDPSRAYRDATLLSVRLRYWYELKVPLANGLVFLAWFTATNGRFTQPSRGLPLLTPGERRMLWTLASGAQAPSDDRSHRRFYLPLTATYSMRMQSNVYRKWLMHAESAEESP